MSVNFSRLFLCLSALAAVQSAYGAGGVTLIDQKAVLSGKVTELDTPGFPVTISESGSYRLGSNLVVPDGGTTAIQITADDVTLDMDGFSIIGPNTCTPNPVRCTISGGSGIGIVAVNPTGPSPANVRVRNGVVRGMGGHGIRMMGDGTSVEHVQSVSNGGPGIVVGQGSIIDSLTELNSSGAAMVGLVVRGSVSMNNVFGIFVRPGGVAIGNVAIGNAATGLAVNNASATNNTANNNGSFGIDADCPGTLVGNTATGNAGGNIHATGVCTMADNAQ
jgi:hypothetical protein